ncbi:MAG: CoA ester lyase [Rhodospirillaceae bacterium]|jgi:citrate lyase subunit beta/citryl-CoA lyase|nr:CoA ester lyase [Rhodospirillales bacterium]MBT3904070.1 CoA ester lyase [Rhodospirillaceae bacterium]MBT4701069.1 CoA ester lyase [Rhodospirillaceae bacterium]MBT5035287.1 CoA ester lyase [Rhodospirillaceae bacterium]MBT6222034.1 CoA ester lyase [Rhodospirillaceae bacterium]
MTLHKKLPVWRSLLYVPVNVERFVEKAHTRGADGIILDLEDSIAPSEKESARTHVKEAARKVGQGGADVTLRINRPWRLAIKDLEVAVIEEVDALVLPKVDSPEHVQAISEIVTELEFERGLEIGRIKYFVLVETPEGVLRMAETAKADPRIVAISVGSEDLSAAASMAADDDALYVSNMHCVMCARAAGILPMGFIGSIAEFNDMDAFQGMIERSRRLGFEGSAAIHPNQVTVLNEVHRPNDEEVEKAKRMIEAYDDAYKQGLGAVQFEGIMIDVPVVERARNIVRRFDAILARARA